jgi:hypothetical protein
MAFPRIEQFEAVLASLSLTKPKDTEGWRSFEVSPEIPATKHTGESEVHPSVTLWAKDHAKLKFEGCVRKLKEELLRQGHAWGDEVALRVLALFAHLSRPQHGGVNLINHVLQKVVSVDASHYLVFLPIDESYVAEWKGFRWGLLDADRFGYRCQKAGSNYFQLYGNQLQGSVAFESPVYKRKAIDWKNLIVDLGNAAPGKSTPRLMLRYFEALSHAHYNQMFDDLDEKQHLLGVFDLGIVEVKSMSRVPYAQRITIYLNFSAENNWGYVVPEGTIININWLPPKPERLQEAAQFESQYALDSATDCEIHNVLKSVCRYAHIGRQWRMQGDFSNGLFNFVIALEILFSDKEAVTASVSSRAAVIVHRPLGLSYSDMQRELSDLYGVRSGYVHRGKPVTEDACSRVEAITREVISCLLRLQLKPESRDEGFLKQWIKRIDWIKAAVEAGVNIEPQTFHEHGIA